jgi:cardiolipin synthase
MPERTPTLLLRQGARHLLLLCMVMTISFCSFYFPPDTDLKKGTHSQSWYSDPHFTALLDEQSNSTDSDGNSAHLLVNGITSFARRYENMKTARFVFVKTFLFTDDEMGRKLASALSEKARSGIPVVLQYDVKGSLESPLVVLDMAQHIESGLPFGEKHIIHEMREAGVIIVPTNSPSRPYELDEWVDNLQRLVQDPQAALKRSGESMILYDYCDHEKYFITGHDNGEIRAILGGMNIAGEYTLGGVSGRTDAISDKAGWHDVDVEIQGPAAQSICQEYMRDMQIHTTGNLPEVLSDISATYLDNSIASRDSVKVRFVTHHPLVDRRRDVEELYRMLLIATPAGEPVFIATAYFAPSKRIRDAILEHTQHGGSVTVLTNSLESNNHPILSVAANYAALDIMRQTDLFKLYEWIPRPEAGEQTMHQKVASFGLSGPVIIGSFNLDAQSAIHNTESAVLITDPHFREEFDKLIEYYESPAHSKRISKSSLETRPILEQIQSFLTHEIAWYWL